MSDPIIDEFVALVTDGKDISDMDPPCKTCKRATYGEIGAKRKRLFLSLGRQVLEKLKLELDVYGSLNEHGEKYINTCIAGPIISGDVSLLLPWTHVYMSHHSPRQEYGDFSWTYVTKVNERNKPTQWMIGEWEKWEALRDLRGIAKRMQEGRPKIEVVGA